MSFWKDIRITNAVFLTNFKIEKLNRYINKINEIKAVRQIKHISIFEYSSSTIKHKLYIQLVYVVNADFSQLTYNRWAYMKIVSHININVWYVCGWVCVCCVCVFVWVYFRWSYTRVLCIMFKKYITYLIFCLNLTFIILLFSFLRLCFCLSFYKRNFIVKFNMLHIFPFFFV